MYEPTQRRVIDFYADLVLPLLEMSPEARAALNVSVQVTRSAQLWSLENEDLPITHRGLRFVTLDRPTTERLFAHITGAQIDPGLERVFGRTSTLRRMPGAILLHPQVARAELDEEQIPPGAGRAAVTAPRIPIVYAITKPIQLYSGQHLLGPGMKMAHNAPFSFGPRLNFPYRVELIELRNPGGGLPVAIMTDDGADDVIIRDLSITQLKSFHSTVIDLSRAKSALISSVAIAGPSTQGIGCQGDSRSLWIENTDLRVTGVPAHLDSMARDATLWNVHCAGGRTERGGPAVVLNGVNSQLWFGSVEPQVSEAVAEDINQFDLSGYGTGVFACHIEGDLDMAMLPQPGQTRSVFLVRQGSRYVHISSSQPAFRRYPVLVERDVASAWIRLPVGKQLDPQPLFNVGLSNLLVNSTFSGTVPEAPGAPWVPLEGAWYGDGGQVHGLSRSLAVRMPLPRLQGNTEPLWQEIRPGADRPLVSVADRTFAMGCWLYNQGQASASLQVALLGERSGGGWRRADSNPHSGRPQWEYLSVVLHTAEDTTALKCVILAQHGASFLVSEPMVVEGLLLPPFHPGPLGAGGGAFTDKVLPTLPVEEFAFDLCPMGGVAEAARFVSTAGYVHDLMVVAPGLGAEERLRISLRFEWSGQVGSLGVLFVTGPGPSWHRLQPRPWVPGDGRLRLQVNADRTTLSGLVAVTIRQVQEI